MKAPGSSPPPSDTHGQQSEPSTGPAECSACGHVGKPVGKGQCAECRCWVPGNAGNLRHGLRRYEDTGVLPDDLRLYRAERFDALVAALGGEDDLSPQRMMLANHAVSLEVTAALQLDFGLRVGADTKRGRAALSDYRASVDSLRRLLSDLGLDVKARPVPTLEQYVAERGRGQAT